MARATLASIIAQVRLLIGDPTGANQQFTDDAIQQRLDAHRTEARFVNLTARPTFNPGGGITYNDYYADIGYWEDDVLLQRLDWNTVTADLAEPIVGHWHFNTQPPGIGMRATGKVFDIYAAGGDLAQMWAAAVARDFQFTSGRDQYYRQQKYDNLISLAKELRSQAQAHSSRLVQLDATPDIEGGGVTYPNVGTGTAT